MYHEFHNTFTRNFSFVPFPTPGFKRLSEVCCKLCPERENYCAGEAIYYFEYFKNLPILESVMSTVKMIEYDEATGLVKEIYDDFRALRGTDRIPDFWKTIATHPPLLERTWNDLKAVMAPGRLDPLTKEMIAVAVSATNGCSYCVNSHTAAAMKLGMDQEMLGELMSLVGMFNTTNKLVEGYQVQPDVFPPQD